MAILKKSGNSLLKKFFDYGNDSAPTIKYKRSIIAGFKLDTPLFSWPKDKATLLGIINTYLANIQLDKLTDNVNLDEALENKTKKEDEEVKENSEEVKDSEDAEKSEEENKATEADKSEENETETSEENSEEGENTEEDPNVDSEGKQYMEESQYCELPNQIYDIDNCTAKMLGCVVRILNYRYKVIKKINEMKRLKAPVDIVNEEIGKVVVYNIVLAKYLPILNKQDVIDYVNLKNATAVFEDVCVEGYEEIPTQRNIETEIKKNKEEQDFDIVSALNYTGISVDKDDFGTYTIKKHGNGNGIKYFIGKQEKCFALSKKACSRFIEQFLNKPIENRKFITPGQVFITYINEAEKSLGINSRSATELSDLFGTMNQNKNAKAYFKDAIRKYSRNAEAWKDFQKLFKVEYYSNKENKDDYANRIHIKQQAKRLLIGEMFEEFLNEGELLTQDQLNIGDYRIGDISRDFGLNIDLNEIKVQTTRIERVEDYAFRLINIAHSNIQEMRNFVQDIIDNYTVDYLRKEKIFLLQQDDQKEFITKKKEYEDLIEKLSYDKAKDSSQQIAYYQQQIDELTQKIGNQEYRAAKEDLLKSKNNFRILLLNAKSQKELCVAEITKATEDAEKLNKKLTIEEKVEIIKRVLSEAPELVFTFDKGKATSWTKHRVGEKAVKREEPLSEVDKIIEKTAARISDESHQKILEENKIRESVKKAQKEERVKSVNAYINAYGSIVGNAGGMAGFGGLSPEILEAQAQAINKQYTRSGGVSPINTQNPGVPLYPNVASTQTGGTSGSGGASGSNGGSGFGSGVLKSNSPNYVAQGSGAIGASAGSSVGTGTVSGGSSGIGGSSTPIVSQPVQPVQQAPVVSTPINVAPVTPVTPVAPVASGMMMGGAPMMGGMPMGGYGYMGAGMSVPPMMPNNQPHFNKDYQNFDFISEGIEPCVIPYIVGYENKGVTVYGNMMEDYATFDKYKYLLSTNNNALYSYLETKKAQIQSPAQIISDLHIRYLKNAMAKSGLATLDSNLSNFDHKSADLRKFITKFVPQNMIDIVTSDYNELISSVNFELLEDLIEHKFLGDLETYTPEKIKLSVQKSASMIASVVKAISSDTNIRKTYEEYSSKMKQSYINSLIAKIEGNAIPDVKIDNDSTYSRMLDYLSFSIKAQNVIIQNEDTKDIGLQSYPRTTFFRQKENADNNIKFGRVLSYEQNEVITTKNDSKLNDNGQVANLFGTLYNFNGSYNKLLLRLKPYNLQSGVKFIENLIDALKEKLDIKTTVIVEEEKKAVVPLVKFAKKDKDKVQDGEAIYDYDDERWFIRKGIVIDKIKVKEYSMLIALGMKYALDREKTKLKEDFYKDGLLNLAKLNETFNDLPEETRSLITSVVRGVMMSKSERFIDYVTGINTDCVIHTNKMLYINKMIMESNSFANKNADEKKETIETLEAGFDRMIDDIKNPHPELYSSIEEIDEYMYLYFYYALTYLFETYTDDERIICPELNNYFMDKKKEFRQRLLTKIRERDFLNGYEVEMVNYFELNSDKILTLDDKPLIEKEQQEQEQEEKQRIKIKNIDVIFKGIYDGFEKAVSNNEKQELFEEIEELRQILQLVGTLPKINSEEKDLEIALPNNQTIICNIKGFVQQYLFRYIIDKEHELGPFAYVVRELIEHPELGEIVKNLEDVAEKLNSKELGINLIAKFSSISLSNNGNVFKIGDNVSTVVEVVNRLKTPTDMQKALNRDVFYREGVASVAKSFEQYFNRKVIENMK